MSLIPFAGNPRHAAGIDKHSALEESRQARRERGGEPARSRREPKQRGTRMGTAAPRAHPADPTGAGGEMCPGTSAAKRPGDRKRRASPGNLRAWGGIILMSLRPRKAAAFLRESGQEGAED